MEFDFSNTNDRMIFYSVAKEPEKPIFDITPLERTKSFDLSTELICVKTLFIIDKIIREYIYDKNYFEQDIYEIIEKYNLFSEEECREAIKAVQYILDRVIVESYTALDYESNEKEDYEKVSYRTDKTTYIELVKIELYKVENKVIYRYNLDNRKYTKIGQLF